MFKWYHLMVCVGAVQLWYFCDLNAEKLVRLLQSLVDEVPAHFAPEEPSAASAEILFSSDDLKEYDGRKGSKGVYIAILGRVFDVQKGKRHYGPGGAYHVFAGRDASRSFIYLGEDHTDDVTDLSHRELLSLRDWLAFFDSKYSYKGKLIGRYYDASGGKTKYSEELELRFNEAEKSQKSKDADEQKFPSCNVEWTQETGSRVWCSKRSGGIERDWIGVPRKLYEIGSDSFRCACIDLDQIQNPNSVQYARRGHIKEYDNCDRLSISCYVKT